MHHFARRTAGIVAAVALVSGIAAGCSKGDKDGKSSDTAMTTTVMATATEHEGEHATEAPKTEAMETSAPETKISTAHGEVAVAGSILEKYNAFGGATGVLGDPIADQKEAPGGGTVQEFEGGAIYSSPNGGTHVVWGEIRNAWIANGGPGGKLGYPTTDELDVTGGKQSDFTGGTITWVDNQITVTEK